jgi:hypothetical protein
MVLPLLLPELTLPLVMAPPLASELATPPFPTAALPPLPMTPPVPATVMLPLPPLALLTEMPASALRPMVVWFETRPPLTAGQARRR